MVNLHYLCTAKVLIMIEILAVTALIIAIGMVFLCVKIIFMRQGSFSSQHIHDNPGLRAKGIRCVLDQDRDLRSASSHAVSERQGRADSPQ